MDFNRDEHGSQGIGTMIIFIALILVAAVAAGVLIQTSSSLQSKSLDVGRQSQEKITTDIEVIQVYANGTGDGYINGGTVDLFTVVIRLGSGSSPIKLSDMLIKLDTPVASQSLTYTLGGSASASNYAANYLINGSNTKTGYIVPGDTIELTFYLQIGINIPESTGATIRVIPKNGAVKPVDFTTPSAMIRNVIQFYP